LIVYSFEHWTSIEGRYDEITGSCTRRRCNLGGNDAVSGAGLVLLGACHHRRFRLGQISLFEQRADHCAARMRRADTAVWYMLHHVLHLTDAG
jgi:hypothetical protein